MAVVREVWDRSLEGEFQFQIEHETLRLEERRVRQVQQLGYGITVVMMRGR